MWPPSSRVKPAGGQPVGGAWGGVAADGAGARPGGRADRVADEVGPDLGPGAEQHEGRDDADEHEAANHRGKIEGVSERRWSAGEPSRQVQVRVVRRQYQPSGSSSRKSRSPHGRGVMSSATGHPDAATRARSASRSSTSSTSSTPTVAVAVAVFERRALRGAELDVAAAEREVRRRGAALVPDDLEREDLDVERGRRVEVGGEDPAAQGRGHRLDLRRGQKSSRMTARRLVGRPTSRSPAPANTASVPTWSSSRIASFVVIG